jgi:hypothetical protein
MILGMSLAAFTLLHVIISLLGIASGLVVLAGMLGGRLLNGWNGFFLLTTIATSVTGFMFHSKSFGPPHIVGVISLIVLAVALFALYLSPTGRIMALDLCGHSSGRSLPQCVRRSRPSVPEAAVPPCSGTQRLRAALCSRTRVGASHLRRTGYPGRQKIPSLDASARVGRAEQSVRFRQL